MYVLYGNRFWLIELQLLLLKEDDELWLLVWRLVCILLDFFLFLFVMFERPCFLLFWSSNVSNPDSFFKSE